VIFVFCFCFFVFIFLLLFSESIGFGIFSLSVVMSDFCCLFLLDLSHVRTSDVSFFLFLLCVFVLSFSFVGFFE